MRRTVAVVVGSIALATNMAEAVPIKLPLDKAIQQADVVVVGTLGKLTEEPKPERGVQRATGTVIVTQVLKGSPELKTVTLQTHVGVVDGPLGYKEGASGIWILNKVNDSNAYRGGNPTSLQPVEKMEEVKAEIEKQVSSLVPGRMVCCQKCKQKLDLANGLHKCAACDQMCNVLHKYCLSCAGRMNRCEVCGGSMVQSSGQKEKKPTGK